MLLPLRPEDNPQSNAERKPRLIIHGGAGNITPSNLPQERYKEYRQALLTILAITTEYMNKPLPENGGDDNRSGGDSGKDGVGRREKKDKYPSSLAVATRAVSLMEDNPLFNSGHGAVFTRDGVQEMEASVMVSRGYKKRGVGVMGLSHVRNPILLAKAVLEHGDEDLGGGNGEHRGPMESNMNMRDGMCGQELDAPSAQGHTLIFGQAAEQLAESYGLEKAPKEYFFDKRRWDEHVRALEREKEGESVTATWSAEEYLPQGTCGAVCMDRDGVVCCATSTGGMTNKLTGRIGDTPTVGAGFWAEQFEKKGMPAWASGRMASVNRSSNSTSASSTSMGMTTVVDMGLSGTGNGDSFLRLGAARQVGAIARYRPTSVLDAVREVTGPRGELQKSAGKRWGETGEGEGGMIAIEGEVVKDSDENVVASGYKIIQEYNCGGMFRAWLDDKGKGHFRVWKEGVEADPAFKHEGEGVVVNMEDWLYDRQFLSS
ncbi:putative isoaspartyl peptidase/L-asparaginase [Zalerion maritima]|uniref:Isoaspartyl peptidase/L-asparaginase n=1 Tax=Zalerion maritima TaxID=339359 RepID=A0AAD5WSD4_9PEZI|nr:putative isoaspartyl peptidase/L-asparaginase [Zalerion maritima]